LGFGHPYFLPCNLGFVLLFKKIALQRLPFVSAAKIQTLVIGSEAYPFAVCAV